MLPWSFPPSFSSFHSYLLPSILNSTIPWFFAPILLFFLLPILPSRSNKIDNTIVHNKIKNPTCWVSYTPSGYWKETTLLIFKARLQPGNVRRSALQFWNGLFVCLLDSAVYTPMDSELWLMAKHVLQVTDFVQTQVIDHLSNVHLFMEPLCVCMQRQFSKLHPLHQILKYHCLGLLGTNKLGFPFLFAPGNGTLDKLTTVGARGAIRMVHRAYQNFNWRSTDFLVNIKVSKAKREAWATWLEISSMHGSFSILLFSHGERKHETYV